jgi:hypothetical protein
LFTTDACCVAGDEAALEFHRGGALTFRGLESSGIIDRPSILANAIPFRPARCCVACDLARRNAAARSAWSTGFQALAEREDSPAPNRASRAARNQAWSRGRASANPTSNGKSNRDLRARRYLLLPRALLRWIPRRRAANVCPLGSRHDTNKCQRVLQFAVVNERR